MNRLRLILNDIVLIELWRGIDFHKNIGRKKIMVKAISASILRNIGIILFLTFFIPTNNDFAVVGLTLVAFGATILGYVALRMRVHSLDFVTRSTERFKSPSRRKSYFDVINVTDSLLGVLFIIVGFSLRILSTLS